MRLAVILISEPLIQSLSAQLTLMRLVSCAICDTDGHRTMSQVDRGLIVGDKDVLACCFKLSVTLGKARGVYRGQR